MINIKLKLNNIFKEGTDGRQLIKDGAFLRIMENSFTKQGQKEFFDPVKFVNSVEDAFNGKGKDISKEIFTKQEMKDLMAFAKKVKDGIPRKDFVTQKAVEETTNLGCILIGFWSIVGVIFMSICFPSQAKR